MFPFAEHLLCLLNCVITMQCPLLEAQRGDVCPNSLVPAKGQVSPSSSGLVRGKRETGESQE